MDDIKVTKLGMWHRDTFEAVGDEMKKREEELRGVTVIDSDMHFAIRVDGRAFHTFTKNLEKPFDRVYRQCMQDAAETVLLQLKPAFAYYQSDEITYVFRGKGDVDYQHPFGGKVAKLLSITASLTSVAFFLAALDREVAGAGLLPHFDARLAAMSYSPETMIKNVAWRENDAMRNSLAMVAQSKFSQKQLSGLNLELQDAKLFSEKDINWATDYTTAERRGTYVLMLPVERELTEEERLSIPEHVRPDPGTVFTRSTKRNEFFSDWNMQTRLDVLWHKQLPQEEA